VKRGNSTQEDTNQSRSAQGLKTGMEGWTSIGVKEETSETLKKMAEELGVTKRAITTLAIDSFYKSRQYKEMVVEFKEINKLRDKYPEIFKKPRD